MKSIRKICLGLLLFLLMSCEIAGPEYDGVLGSIEESHVVLTNRYGTSVYFIAYGRSSGVEVDWFPGISSDIEIQHGETIAIPMEDIFLSESAEKINVFWWDARLVDGERKAGEIRHLILEK